jgi:hypothetical protein
MNFDALDRAYAMCDTFDKTINALEEAVLIMKKAVTWNNDLEREEK